MFERVRNAQEQPCVEADYWVHSEVEESNANLGAEFRRWMNYQMLDEPTWVWMYQPKLRRMMLFDLHVKCTVASAGRKLKDVSVRLTMTVMSL